MRACEWGEHELVGRKSGMARARIALTSGGESGIITSVEGRRRGEVANAAVCKTAIHRFKSDRRLHNFRGRGMPGHPAEYAEVAELVDAWDLKSHGWLTPVPVRFRPSAVFC